MRVRISRGQFDPAAAVRIAALLTESGEELVPAIRRLPGLVRYYGGIDREHGVIVNVSVWESEAHALQMATLPEMLAQRARFEPAGVEFEPIRNYAVDWSIDP